MFPTVLIDISLIFAKLGLKNFGKIVYKGFWSDAHRPANAKWHLANYKSEQSEQYERSSCRERSEFTTAGGLGGAVSPLMGSRGEPPENFAVFTFCGRQFLH